jgi:uncharacterized flavoprotein (TIGR03862 family)
MDYNLKMIAIIGGGPAGLMAAEVISQHGTRVDVYDSMTSLGRKFLMAGKSGLNLTHSEPFENFVRRYGAHQKEVEAWLKNFTPDDLRQWARDLGIESFVGTSGRVFPVGMKASPLLRAWLKRLDASGVRFHLRYKWTGWSADGALRFETPEGETNLHADAVILALGGGSWARLGSTGEWVNWLRQVGVPVEALKPSNCGFDVAWSEHFRARFDGQPLKTVVASFQDFQQQGEFIVTKEGVQGSLIYAASARLRDEIEASGSATLFLDLAPGSTLEKLTAALARPRGSRSMSSHIEKTVGLKGVKMGLLWEFVPKDDIANPEKLAAAIKHLPIQLVAPRPLDEAISSAGGVEFAALNESLMIRSLPGVFCAGEMLDWEAQTGGYLLTACFASGRVAGLGALNWIQK